MAQQRLISRAFGLLLGALVLLNIGTAARAETYTSGWGTITDPAGSVYFNTPVALAKDAGGNVYAADMANSRIVKMSSAGAVLATYGKVGNQRGQFNLPFGVAIDKAGNILVTDTGNYRVQKFDANMNFIASWGTQGTGPGQFAFPREIAVDSQNRYYVTDEYNHRVQVFSSNGTYLFQFGGYGTGPAQFRLPQGIAIDSKDNVYVCDTYNERVQKLTASGTWIAQIGTTGMPGDSANLLNRARSVGVDAADNVFVVDTFNHKVKKYDSALTYQYSVGGFPAPLYPNAIVHLNNGSFYVSDTGNSQVLRYTDLGTSASLAAIVGTARTQNGQFSEPLGVAVGPTGRVYVSDRFNHRVQVFNSSGAFLSKWGKNGGAGGFANFGWLDGEFIIPSQIATDLNGKVYVADAGNARIQVFDANGVFIKKLGGFGVGNGQFISPIGVAVDLKGNIFVSDYGNSRVQKFDANGTYLMQWGSYGTGNGQFRQPMELAVDLLGNVYVADRVNGRIQKFNNNGMFITKWGTNRGVPNTDELLNWGKGNGEFFLPNGIRVAGAFVYVSDSSNNRMQKFTLSGTYVGKWSGFGGKPGQMFSPAGIGVDVFGNVYSADLLLNRVQKFRPF
ncbi:MAG: 6-bladed beta-propeller [Burkholderiales bacterium]|nr:6-bladed beta-propeller [Burkholderiales bacterium]